MKMGSYKVIKIRVVIEHIFWNVSLYGEQKPSLFNLEHTHGKK